MRTLFAASLPLIAAACASYADLPLASPISAAADPVAVAPAEPGPTVNYSPQDITEPGDWRSLNDAQSEGAQ